MYWKAKTSVSFNYIFSYYSPLLTAKVNYVSVSIGKVIYFYTILHYTSEAIGYIFSHATKAQTYLGFPGLFES